MNKENTSKLWKMIQEAGIMPIASEGVSFDYLTCFYFKALYAYLR